MNLINLVELRGAINNENKNTGSCHWWRLNWLLYSNHLTKLGWSNVVLLERDELTSGSTWHAAAGIHGLHDSTNISRIQHYTMNLYKQLEEETGQGCGIFQPGSLYLAQTEEREHQLKIQAAKAKLYGMNFHEVSITEAENLHPFVNFEGVRCIM